MKLSSTAFLSLLTFIASCWSGEAADEAFATAYLKEILLGRCYFKTPIASNHERTTCPNLVGSIMNILESHLDADITASSFESYLEEADFSSPVDKAVFFLRFFGSAHLSWAVPPGWTSPEDTPGGALFKDLVFCGVDQRDNCSIEKSNAYWTFWEAGM